MKLNRHQSRITVTIILLVSVFFVSCGIPTFCSLDNIKIGKNGDKAFKITGSDDDINIVEIGPGLLICYVVGDTSINSSQIINKFASEASTKIKIDYNNLILNTENYSLYAFSTKDDESIKSVTNPLYCLDLRPYIDSGKKSLNVSLKLDNCLWINDELIFDLVNTYTGEKLKTFYANTKDLEGNYIYFFVAFSAEVGEFNNNYWSNLVNIGSISK